MQYQELVKRFGKEKVDDALTDLLDRAQEPRELPLSVDPSDLIGIAELAERLGVKHPTIVAWRKRYVNFPKPVVSLRCGPIYLESEVVAWREQFETQKAAKRNLPHVAVVLESVMDDGVQDIDGYIMLAGIYAQALTEVVARELQVRISVETCLPENLETFRQARPYTLSLRELLAWVAEHGPEPWECSTHERPFAENHDASTLRAEAWAITWGRIEKRELT